MLILKNSVRTQTSGIVSDEPAGTSTMYTWEGGTGTVVITGIEGLGAPGNLHRISFLAFNPGSTNIRTRGDVYSYNKDQSQGYTDRTINNLAITNTSRVLTYTNGGTLLELANAFKDDYFGGVTQTPSSLMAYLNDKYGVHDGYSYSITTGGNVVEYKSLCPEENTTEAVFGYDKCETAIYTFAPMAAVTWTGEAYSLDATYNDDGKIAAALIFGDPVPPSQLRFDVYVDGTRDPNVSIRWVPEIIGDDFNLQMVNPIVWTIPRMSSDPPPYVKSEDGIIVPDEHNAGFIGTTFRKYANTWPGQYDNPYLTEFNTDTSGVSTIDKIAEYGIDQIADQMCYYMRFNYQLPGASEMMQTWGDLWEVRVPRTVSGISDIYAEMINNSVKQSVFNTVLIVHLGAPPDEIPDDDDEYPDGTDADGTDPGVYDPDVPPHDFSTGESTGFSGKAILTKTYAMTSLVMQNVGSKLWSQSYFDVLKIQNNPIENIVSVKWFPFSVVGPTGSVKVGDVDFQINADVVDSIYKFTLGSIRYDADDKSNPSFLDMSPFTTIKLHLPYCGIIQLDATEMLNRKITVKYTVDLVSGDCMAFIYLDDNIPYMNVAGHCGVDIPLTSTNRIQAEMRAASTTISAVTGAAAHMVSGDLAGAAMDAAQGALSIGGMDYTSQRTSSHSPACTSTGNRACYLEIFKPAYKESAGFKSRHGYPCHLYKQLGSFTGFVKCDARTKIDFAMTKRENEMLEQLLTSGVYV